MARLIYFSSAEQRILFASNSMFCDDVQYVSCVDLCTSQAITLCLLMDSSTWYDTINLGRFVVDTAGSHVIVSK